MRLQAVAAVLAAVLAGCASPDAGSAAPGPGLVPVTVHVADETTDGPPVQGADVTLTIALCDGGTGAVSALFAAAGEDLCQRSRVTGRTDARGDWAGAYDPVLGTLESVQVAAAGRVAETLRAADGTTFVVALMRAEITAQVHVDVPVGAYTGTLASPPFQGLVEVRLHARDDVNRAYLARLRTLVLDCRWANGPEATGTVVPHYGFDGSASGMSSGTLAPVRLAPGPQSVQAVEDDPTWLAERRGSTVQVGVVTDHPVVGTQPLPVDVVATFRFA